MGAGAVLFIIIVGRGEEGACLLAPGPPCKQVLAVVGDGCWGAVSLLPHTLAVDTHDPPYEQVLMDVGGGYHVVQCCCCPSLAPPSSSCCGGVVSFVGIAQRYWHPRSTLRAEAHRHGAGAGHPLPVPGVIVS
jgi:hypothetical protein